MTTSMDSGADRPMRRLMAALFGSRHRRQAIHATATKFEETPGNGSEIVGGRLNRAKGAMPSDVGASV